MSLKHRYLFESERSEQRGTFFPSLITTDGIVAAADVIGDYYDDSHARLNVLRHF